MWMRMWYGYDYDAMGCLVRYTPMESLQLHLDAWRTV